MELRFAADVDPDVRAALGYADAAGALHDPRGTTVRCTPRRWTVRGPLCRGRLVFRKYRRGRGALREWRALPRLVAAGFAVPRPVCVARRGSSSVVVLTAVAGRPLDALLRDAISAGEAARATRFAVRVVAPMVRRLHDLGFCHRDLYVTHLFAPSLDGDDLAVIDVERVFRPRWRRRRWRVKDLAALLASIPAGFPRTGALRFLLAYEPARSRWRPLARAILAKARRIRSRPPRYGN